MLVEYFFENGDYEARECPHCVFKRKEKVFRTYGEYRSPMDSIASPSMTNVKKVIVNGRIIYDAGERT